MKYKILILLLFISTFAYSQQLTFPSAGGSPTSVPTYQGGVKAKLYSFIPIKDTLNNAATQYVGAYTIRPQDTLVIGIPPVYVTNGHYWNRIDGTSTIINYIDSSILSINFQNGVDSNSRLISGSVIIDSNFDGHTTILYYKINGVYFTIPATPFFQITGSCTSADRYTVAYVDTLGNFGLLDGPCSNNPVQIPNVDAGSQLAIALYYIPANSTTPFLVSNTDVYKEGIEWDTIPGNITNINFHYQTNPYAGLYSIRFPQHTNTRYFELTDGLSHLISDFAFLSYHQRLNATFPAAAVWGITLWKDSSVVSSNEVRVNTGNYGYVRTTSGSYQRISVPTSAWNMFSGTFNKIRFTQRGTTAAAEQLDNIILQTGGGNTNTSIFIQTINGIGGAHVIIPIGDSMNYNADTSLLRLIDKRTGAILASVPSLLSYMQSADTCIVIDTTGMYLTKTAYLSFNNNCGGGQTMQQTWDVDPTASPTISDTSNNFDIYSKNTTIGAIQDYEGNNGSLSMVTYNSTFGIISQVILESSDSSVSLISSSNKIKATIDSSDITPYNSVWIDTDGFLHKGVTGSGSTLQQAFDASILAGDNPTIRANQNNLSIDSVNKFEINEVNGVNKGFFLIDSTQTRIINENDTAQALISATVDPIYDGIAAIDLQASNSINGISYLQEITITPLVTKLFGIHDGVQRAKIVIENPDTLLTVPDYIWAADGDTLKKVAYPTVGANMKFNEEFTGSTSTTLTLSQTYLTGTIRLYKNGARLLLADFTEATGTTITLNVARLTGDVFTVDFNY